MGKLVVSLDGVVIKEVQITKDKTMAGMEIERVTYTDLPPWPAEADGDGRSLVRISPGQRADAAWNWRAGAAGGGQPGTFKGEPFAAWLVAGGFAGPLSPAPGGVNALVRYAAGLDLGGADQPELQLRPGPGTAVLTFTRRLTAADKIDFDVEFSGNGRTWQSVALDGPAAVLTSRSLAAHGREQLTVFLPAGEGRLLARVRMILRP